LNTAANRQTLVKAHPRVVNLESAGTVAGWFGVVVPAKTPRPVIDRLHREIVRILNSKAVLDRLVNEGSGVGGGYAGGVCFADQD